MSQINSLYNPQISWLDAFRPGLSIDWSAKRMRGFFNSYKKQQPSKPDSVLWDAAVCAHNNPSAANEWAKNGFAPHEQAATYVNAVKAAIF